MADWRYPAFWDGMGIGMHVRRAELVVGHKDGMHTRPKTLLFNRLRTETPLPKCYVKLGVLDENGVASGGHVYASHFTDLFHHFRARHGDRIEALALADTAGYAEKAIAVCRECIEMPEVPTHHEVANGLQHDLPEVAEWMRSEERAGMFGQYRHDD